MYFKVRYNFFFKKVYIICNFLSNTLVLLCIFSVVKYKNKPYFILNISLCIFQMTRSPPGPHQASPNQSGSIGNNSSSYNSATWERTLRMNSSSSLVVPPPLGSAPPPSTANAALSPIHHKPVRASLSSLSSSQMSTSGEASTANMVNISNSNPGLSMDESWYRSNKIATAKTLQLQRQLSAGSFKTAGGKNLIFFFFIFLRSSFFFSFLNYFL